MSVWTLDGICRKLDQIIFTLGLDEYKKKHIMTETTALQIEQHLRSIATSIRTIVYVLGIAFGGLAGYCVAITITKLFSLFIIAFH